MAVNQDNPDMQADHDPQLSGLYRAAAAEAPPTRLDVAVQAAARRAVGARPRPAGASFLRAWRVPVSIAAVLVLSVSMVTLTVRQKGEQAAGERLMEPAFTASAPASRADPAPAPRLAEAPSAPAAAERQRHGVPPAPRAPARDAATAGSQVADASPSVVRPAPSASGYAASPESTVPAARRAAPTAEEGAAPAPPSHSTMQAPPSPAEPASAQQLARPQAQLARREGVSGSAKTTDAPGIAGLIRAYDKEHPDKWLEKIEMLRREGKAAEAGEMLTEFRKRYPDHPLPADLR